MLGIGGGHSQTEVATHKMLGVLRELTLLSALLMPAIPIDDWTNPGCLWIMTVFQLDHESPA